MPENQRSKNERKIPVTKGGELWEINFINDPQFNKSVELV